MIILITITPKTSFVPIHLPNFHYCNVKSGQLYLKKGEEVFVYRWEEQGLGPTTRDILLVGTLKAAQRHPWKERHVYMQVQLSLFSS